MKRVAVLGSTGSIGKSTLDVIASHPEELSVFGLAARSRIDVLQQQVRDHHPQRVVVLDEDRAAQLRGWCKGTTDVLHGVDGMCELVTHPDVDIVVVGTSGRDALIPLFEAIERGKQIALASKELLVMAGELIMQAVRRAGATLIPVDSEHAALSQALQGIPRAHVERIVLTGSGGPLWSVDPKAMAAVSREQVLRHPKWQMGPKITVDSATLMNKGLEVIEAHWLFDMPWDRIGVIIHPQAVIHAIVELIDGTCLAQMSGCDMRLPIQQALSFPARWPTPWAPLRLSQLSGLQFVEPDLDRFPCLALAWQAARLGGTACTVLSAANDVAVDAYLHDQLAFIEIPSVIHHALAEHQAIAHPSLEEIVSCDTWARHAAHDLIRAGVPSWQTEPQPEILPRS